ncbi:RNA-binding protein [Candidatus Daviesbacteria bacterium]|nr:RNA-binding protein [Candidatus Daviesbacteria bacterium]
MTKLFIGGIPYSATNEQLEEMFSKFGTVSSAQIVIDRYTNQSKGFAFVEMPNDEEAQAAIKELDGFGMEGRKIGVSVARPREDNRGFDRSKQGFHGNSSRSDYSRRGGNSFLKGSHRR